MKKVDCFTSFAMTVTETCAVIAREARPKQSRRMV